MALIEAIERIDLQAPKVHGRATSSYTAFHTDDGNVYFQIDTYGV